MVTEEQLLGFMKNVENGMPSYDSSDDDDLPTMLNRTWGHIAVRNGIQETGFIGHPHDELRDPFINNGVIVYNSGCATTEGRIPGTVVTFGITDRRSCFISIREFKHLVKYFAVPRRYKNDNDGQVYKWMIETDEDIFVAEPEIGCVDMNDAIMNWTGLQQFKREMVPKMLSGDSEIQWLSGDVFCNDDVIMDISESGSPSDPVTIYIRDDSFNDLIVGGTVDGDYNMVLSEVYEKVREVFRTDHQVHDECMLFKLVADIYDDVYRDGIEELDLRPTPINKLTGDDGIYSNSA